MNEHKVKSILISFLLPPFRKFQICLHGILPPYNSNNNTTANDNNNEWRCLVGMHVTAVKAESFQSSEAAVLWSLNHRPALDKQLVIWRGRAVAVWVGKCVFCVCVWGRERQRGIERSKWDFVNWPPVRKLHRRSHLCGGYKMIVNVLAFECSNSTTCWFGFKIKPPQWFIVSDVLFRNERLPPSVF